MISNVLKWFIGGGFGVLGRQLNEAYENRLRAKTRAQKIRAESEIERLGLQLSILRVESGYLITRWIRPAFALPFIIYDFKIIVWDKVLGLGVTEGLSPEFWQLQMIVFGAYFLVRPLEKLRG